MQNNVRALTVEASTTPEAPVIEWNAPDWSTDSTQVEEAVMYTRAIGSIIDLDGDLVDVELVQRDQICSNERSSSIARQPAFVRICGVRIDPGEAEPLARLLTTAAGQLVSTWILHGGSEFMIV